MLIAYLINLIEGRREPGLGRRWAGVPVTECCVVSDPLNPSSPIFTSCFFLSAPSSEQVSPKACPWGALVRRFLLFKMLLSFFLAISPLPLLRDLLLPQNLLHVPQHHAYSFNVFLVTSSQFSITQLLPWTFLEFFHLNEYSFPKGIINHKLIRVRAPG